MTLSKIFAENLRGHQYIEARGLSPQIAKDRQHTCDSCRRAEMLPVVMQIVNAWPMPKKVTRIK